jgi:hypothetical protein
MADACRCLAPLPPTSSMGASKLIMDRVNFTFTAKELYIQGGILKLNLCIMAMRTYPQHFIN